MYVRNTEVEFDKNDLYYCYSPNLKKFLCKVKNVSYVVKGINSETNKTYWVFLRTNFLCECLTEWSNNAKKD